MDLQAEPVGMVDEAPVDHPDPAVAHRHLDRGHPRHEPGQTPAVQRPEPQRGPLARLQHRQQ